MRFSNCAQVGPIDPMCHVTLFFHRFKVVNSGALGIISIYCSLSSNKILAKIGLVILPPGIVRFLVGHAAPIPLRVLPPLSPRGYRVALEMADRHVVFKHGVKEIADQHGKAVTFMAKYMPGEAGNSCHVHMSLWKGGRNLFWDKTARRGSRLFRQFLGGLIKYSPELCLFFGPTINSYKRYQAGSWAPTRMAWSTDNRTVGFRVVGHGNSFRLENRMPGADANPYLALSAMLAAGMAGIKERLDCGEEYRGNAYIDPKLARLPSSLRDAADLFDRSKSARATFGDAVVEFYVHHARLELRAFGDAVTDWEKQRYFERI